MPEQPIEIIQAGFSALEHEALTLIDELKDMGFDPRWLSIARTDIERGFMAVDRAIAGRVTPSPQPARPLDKAGRDCIEVVGDDAAA